MTFEAWSEPARKTLLLAVQYAAAWDSSTVCAEHLLLALLENEEAAGLLRGQDTAPETVRERLEGVMTRGSEPGVQPRPLSEDPEPVLRRAALLGCGLTAPQVRPAHMLLAVFDDRGTASRVLDGLGIARFRLVGDIAKLTGASATTLAPGGDSMANRHTPTAFRTYAGAKAAARELRHPRIDTQHVLIGVLDAGGPVPEALGRLGVTADKVRRKAQASTPRLKDVLPATLLMTREAKAVLADALRVSTVLKSLLIDSDHIVLALIRQGGTGARLLAEFGVDFDKARSVLPGLAPRTAAKA
jgi:ATP-dependent Clp protease ATP-binding subunit ClpA